MGKRLVGIDAGTTRIKAVAFSLEEDAICHSGISDVVDQLDDKDEVIGGGVTGQGDGCWLIGDKLYDICDSSQFPGSS